MNLPLDKPSRDALREMYAQRALAEAARKARSIKCGNDTIGLPLRHAGQPDGCRNNGSGCLCECHDRAEQEGPQQ